MSRLIKLTETNGFDFKDLNNARQNNYAWSMSELDEYIYVGTGRNILYNIIKSIQPQTNIPALINPNPVINRAEIWRYKKDGSLPWKRVYRAEEGSGIVGFRYMINHSPFDGSPAIYAATFGTRVQILKTTNGVDWFILPDSVLEGTSSRAMVTHNGKLYLATINELASDTNAIPLLYRSEDPEFYPWQQVINPAAPGFDPIKNPRGAISNMAIFNNRLYVATSNSDGVQLWRTNGEDPKVNDWTLIADKGFGNTANRYTLSIGVFKNYLYLGMTKPLPLSWFIPSGCEIVRVDKEDDWEIIVGARRLNTIGLTGGEELRSRSGLGPGFNNPFNVYAWQIQEYNDRLYISTFDDSSNMEVILNTLLANRFALYQLIGETITNLLITIYRSVVEILDAIHYPIGFDLYSSEDGIHFSSLTRNGLNNPNNYGGRILFVDDYNELYLGTANPFQGCEIWNISGLDSINLSPCDSQHYINLRRARHILNEKYTVIHENMPTILKFMQSNNYHMFINE